MLDNSLTTGQSLITKLSYLYGEEKGKETAERLDKMIQEAKKNIICQERSLWDEKDIILITYADSFYEEGKPTLGTLSQFLDLHLEGVIDDVHILPFFPYSSDRGFSIMDYFSVKKEFGDWEDIQRISGKFRLMSDFVLNHISAKHPWFQKFLAGDPKYEDYFIWFEKEKIPWEDIKKVNRQRATPLLTQFPTKKGERWVWTSYSVGVFTDQIDLNYHNPEVFLQMVEVMVNLFSKKTQILRLDAVAGLWKELGTSCSSLPQTHVLLQVLRTISDSLCPYNIIITESSRLTHKENVTYFGDGTNETHMTYNFPIAPLTLYAFYTGNVIPLTDWAKESVTPTEKTAFFNFLDCHDGINVGGAHGYLNEQEYRSMFAEVEKRGGKFSWRSLPDGTKTVKEMNITWWSAVNGGSAEPFDIMLRRFITSRAIPMSLAGIPAVYYLSLFGGENDIATYERTKVGRDLNRANYEYQMLAKKLADAQSKEARVFAAMKNLMQKRRSIKAFHPNAKQEILSLDSRIFAVLRGEGEVRVLALHNVSREKVEVRYESKTFTIEPYGFLWQKV